MVEVKLYAYLRDGRGKVVMMEHHEGMIVQDIIDELKIEIKEISIIICDGYDHKYEKMKDYPVNEGSLVHIFPPVAGG